MEILIAAVVIIILLLILGISIGVIVQGILWILEILLLLMTLFFAASVIFLLLAKKQQAEFLRIDKTGKMGNAVYRIDGREYRNTYPAEGILQNLIYRRKESSVRFRQFGKLCVLFDRYSIVCAALGFPLSAAGAVLLGVFLMQLL